MLQLHFTPFPILTTERLILRQPVQDDDKEIFILRTDKEVNKYIQHRQKTNTIEEARQFIQKITGNINNNESIMWAITLKDEPKLIGTIVYWNIMKEKHSGEIGYELLPAFQGKGIMQEALSKIIEYGFENMKLRSIEAYTHRENTASRKLLEKNHFKRDPALEKEIEGTEEAVYNIIYSLTKI